MPATAQKPAVKQPAVVRYDNVELLELLAVTPETRVDRTKFMVFGVKILGQSSPNRHGLDVDGTEYTPQAMQQARNIYEGKKVNINHPPRSNPGQERDAHDRSGKLLNVRVMEDGLYGDLKLLPSHPMTARILDAADDPDLHDCFAMSHNAVGRGEVRNRKYIVTEIPEVRSVDIVADGGTNRSLFESKEGTKAMKKTLRAIMEAIADRKVVSVRTDKDRTAQWKDLLEMDDYGGMEMDPPPAAPDMGAGAAPPEEMNHEQHLAHMLKAIVLDDALSPEEKCSKIEKALKLLEEEPAEETEEEDTETPPEGEEGEKKPKEDKGKKDNPFEKKDGMESKEYKEYLQLKTDKHVRQLCESLQYVPCDEIELKAIVGLGLDADRKAYIRKLKERAKTPGKKVTPTTTGVPRHVQESAETITIPGSYIDTEGMKKRAGYWRA